MVRRDRWTGPIPSRMVRRDGGLANTGSEDGAADEVSDRYDSSDSSVYEYVEHEYDMDILVTRLMQAASWGHLGVVELLVSATKLSRTRAFEIHRICR